MKRKAFALVLSLLLVFSMGVPSMANDVTVKINGEVLVTEVPAQIVNSRTVLPMRAVFEALGATVQWVEADRMIFATKDDSMIVMQIDVPKMTIDKASSEEKKVIELDLAPFIQDGRTLVPVRAAAEALDAKVEWDDTTRTVLITK